MYDVGQKESFDALDLWLAEMKQELGPHGNMENIIFVVCANKVKTGIGYWKLVFIKCLKGLATYK